MKTNTLLIPQISQPGHRPVSSDFHMGRTSLSLVKSGCAELLPKKKKGVLLKQNLKDRNVLKPKSGHLLQSGHRLFLFMLKSSPFRLPIYVFAKQMQISIVPRTWNLLYLQYIGCLKSCYSLALQQPNILQFTVCKGQPQPLS